MIRDNHPAEQSAEQLQQEKHAQQCALIRAHIVRLFDNLGTLGIEPQDITIAETSYRLIPIGNSFGRLDGQPAQRRLYAADDGEIVCHAISKTHEGITDSNDLTTPELSLITANLVKALLPLDDEGVEKTIISILPANTHLATGAEHRTPAALEKELGIY